MGDASRGVRRARCPMGGAAPSTGCAAVRHRLCVRCSDGGAWAPLDGDDGPRWRWLLICSVAPICAARSRIPRSPKPSGATCAASKPRPSSPTASTTAAGRHASVTRTRLASACLTTLLSASCAMRYSAICTSGRSTPAPRTSKPSGPRAPAGRGTQEAQQLAQRPLRQRGRTQLERAASAAPPTPCASTGAAARRPSWRSAARPATSWAAPRRSGWRKTRSG